MHPGSPECFPVGWNCPLAGWSVFLAGWCLFLACLSHFSDLGPWTWDLGTGTRDSGPGTYSNFGYTMKYSSVYRDATVRDGGVHPDLLSSRRTAPAVRINFAVAPVRVGAVRAGAYQKTSPESSSGTSKPSQTDSA